MIKDPRLIFVAFTLNMLVRNYGFMPNVDNFVCIVDKLDIHGSKNKAKRVIYGVQFGAHSTKTIPITSYKIPQKQFMVISYLKEWLLAFFWKRHIPSH
jgi:hypothetical protein